jgi:hypothetical protein
MPQEPGGSMQALRLYGVVFGVVVALMETEWQVILTWFRFAENWIARGFVQAFIAALTMEVRWLLAAGCWPPAAAGCWLLACRLLAHLADCRPALEALEGLVESLLAGGR